MSTFVSVVAKLCYLKFRLRVAIHRMRHGANCTLAKGARLELSSVVYNPRADATAISIGENSQIAGQLHVFGHGGEITIGHDCYVSEGTRIWSAKSIAIGDRVLISHNVNVHDFNSHSLSATARHEHFKQIRATGHPEQLPDVPSAPITIEDDAWIGFNATILKGVTIGRGAVVGACSVVTKDVAPFTVVAGNPARVIGESRA